MTTPLMKSLSENGYQVDVLARKSNIDILCHNPTIHQLFSLEDIAPSFPLRWIELTRWIRKARYDVLAIPHAKPKELVYVAASSGVNKRVLMQAGILGRITGNICLRSNLYSHPRHMSEVWLDIAKSLNILPNNPKPEIFLTTGEQDWAKQKIVEKLGIGGKRVIGLHPGSAGNTCNLPFEDYSLFVQKILIETDFKIVITGSASEKLLIEQWPHEILNSDRVWVSAGELTLRQLASIIKQLFVYVCSGTGPLHIANAVGASTFSPFCSRIGHNNTYWGNTNGKGQYINFKTEFCSTQTRNCLFRGACDAGILFEHFRKSIR